MNAGSLIAIARINKQVHVATISTKVVAETSRALFILIVFASWGIPMSIPRANPSQLMASVKLMR